MGSAVGEFERRNNDDSRAPDFAWGNSCPQSRHGRSVELKGTHPGRNLFLSQLARLLMRSVPVVTIGGGGCRLSISAFLSDYGVEHILLERKNETSTLPKAQYFNQRTMETFRLHSLNEEIQKKSCPARLMSRVAWATSLGGSDTLGRRVIHKVACFSGDDSSPNAQAYVNDARERSANLPLCRMELILQRLSEEKNPGRVCFNHTVVDFSDQEDHVLVTVKNAEG